MNIKLLATDLVDRVSCSENYTCWNLYSSSVQCEVWIKSSYISRLSSVLKGLNQKWILWIHGRQRVYQLSEITEIHEEGKDCKITCPYWLLIASGNQYINQCKTRIYRGYGKKVHCPGIEPGSQEWESCMIPLHQQCFGTGFDAIQFLCLMTVPMNLLLIA